MDSNPNAITTPLPAFDCPTTMLERVFRRYAEPHRRYHTWAHVQACLEARHLLTETSLPEVDLALVFHDAIYEPLATDNEARSARLLLEEGRRAWLHESLLQRAQVLVHATAQGVGHAVDNEETCIVVDADLSILGSDPSTFEEYERLVRQEFGCVDDPSYAIGRAKLLTDFLERPFIYATKRAQRLWESRARSNLEQSLARLGG